VSEFSRIERLTALFRSPAGQGIELAIGDDTAVLAPPEGAKLLWTIDDQVEGTHFRRDLLSLEDLGYRATMAAASDVAAMGGTPWCILAALVLPPSLRDDELEELTRGQKLAADELGAPIVGGNLARGPALTVTTTVLGAAFAPITRAGGKVGDGLWVAGALGLAAAGFRGLDRGEPVPDAALSAWRRPRALVAAGRAMASVAHAAIDVSDGLAQDAGHLANGMKVVLYADALLATAPPALLVAAKALDAEPLDLILTGGEDYALVCASADPIMGYARIGELTAGEGIWLRDGARETRVTGGYDHFAGR
jgi:thiamine-monophosphate kinase